MKNSFGLGTRALTTLAVCVEAILFFVSGNVSAREAPIELGTLESLANSDLLLLGPVDQAKPSTSQVHVLGQWITVSPDLTESKDLVGNAVAVFGALTPSGTYKVEFISEQRLNAYVPGATHLYVKGAISSVDKLSGTLKIGELSVSYGAALHTLNASDLGVGKVVFLSGFQYANQLSFYADGGFVVAEKQSLGQSGSGAEVLRQSGSGAYALGQSGSGAAHLGQSGSDEAALGQSGSGAAVLGQSGSGAYALGQSGSGDAHLGQSGSGEAALGQSGSGAEVLGQSGSGAFALGQSGSGDAHLGQSGSGEATLGQSGSGAMDLGQSGSGAL
jgi:hypothetical protein